MPAERSVRATNPSLGCPPVHFGHLGTLVHMDHAEAIRSQLPRHRIRQTDHTGFQGNIGPATLGKASEPMLMILTPPPAARIAGSMARSHSKVSMMLTRITASRYASGIKLNLRFGSVTPAVPRIHQERRIAADQDIAPSVIICRARWGHRCSPKCQPGCANPAHGNQCAVPACRGSSRQNPPR